MNNDFGVRKETGANKTQILANIELQMSIGIRVSATGITANAEGKKIVKAGTPMAGNIAARLTGFTALKTAGTVTGVAGVLLHDCDVTAGDNNGTLLIFGFVNTNRLEADIKPLHVAALATALPMIKSFPAN